MGVTVRRLRNGLNAMVAAEPEMTRYDSVIGDSDCTTTLKQEAEGIDHIHSPDLSFMWRTNSILGILRLLSPSPSQDVVTLLSMIASRLRPRWTVLLAPSPLYSWMPLHRIL